MKVVHLVPAMEQGGVESVVLSLNRAVVGAGGESVVVSRGGRLAETIERDGGRHVALDLKSKNPLTYFSRARRLRKTLAELAPDLVCVHSRVPAWLFVRANRALGVRWISYAHGANSVSRYSAVMTKGDLVVTPSRFLADFLLAHYGAKDATLKERLRVIPPCVDTARFDPNGLDEAFVAEMRRAWGIGPDDFVTMAVGRITPLKGLDALIREVAAKPAGKLVIVGEADRRHRDYAESLKKLAAELGAANRIVFAGAQQKVPECLSIASEVVSANTTKPETFGLSIAEALAMNRPVRLFRRFGGAAEILDAVAASGAESSRAAVISLYNFDIMSARTLETYARLTRH